MDDETRFFVFLIECYAADHDRPTAEVLREWDEHDVTQKIYDSYWMYHQEAITNAYEDIDHLVATGEYKW